MTLQEFFDKNNGQPLDFDGYYGDQCVDEVQFYNRDVINALALIGNAIDIWTTYPKDFYEQIANTPDNFTNPGDIIIWGTDIGKFGHIAVVKSADANSFTSLDQNWNGHQYCEFVIHNYTSVLGWLRPKPIQRTPSITQSEIDAIRNDRDKNWNLYQEDEKQVSQLKQTIDNLNQIINDRNNDITQLNAKVSTLETQVTTLQQQIQTLQDQANKVPDMAKQLDQAIGDRGLYIKLNNAQKLRIDELQGMVDKGKPMGFFNKLVFLFS